MTKAVYHWDLRNFSDVHSLERYCHNCGRKVIFTDSRRRRRNANGKTIYEYAVYRCEQGHTWNMPVNIYKATQNREYREKDCLDEVIGDEASGFGIIHFGELKNEGVNEIEIILGEVAGRWRIDKLLGERIQDISRTKICQLIRLGRVFVDGNAVKPNYSVRREQKISILLDVRDE